jgi:hypothetical protein
MERWFLLQFRVAQSMLGEDGKLVVVKFPQVYKLIQAQTEAEAVEKFKRYNLKPLQAYVDHINHTIL